MTRSKPGHQPVQFGPGALVLPVEAKSMAHELFMEIACDLEPELMRSFFRDVYQSEEMIVDVWPSLGTQRIDLGPLTGRIDDWARRWNLAQADNRPHWVFVEASVTIAEWEERGISRS